ncbi:MAG: DUF262 domain-containing protein [Synergistaceae bacterium]|nr:DUF262 domain-containing protein [Synergistaceae bacterium]
MNAIQGSFLGILDGKTQYILPTFQRHYSWDKEQCEQLWNDLKNMEKRNKKAYFIGSIVNQAVGIVPSGVRVQQFVLIDGQQRLATIMLILIALRNYCIANPEDKNVNFTSDEINNMWLKNQYAKDDEHYKLLLVGENRETLIDLIEEKIEGKTISEETRSKLLQNYKFFEEKISESKSEMTPAALYEAIGKLQIVNITLDESDDPQAIFESLNSTGKDLSKSDLIRNFVLMGLDYETQTEIYKKFWLPMEKLFGNEKQDALMDDFFRDYLTMKLSRIIKEDLVYDEFKKWFYFESNFEKKIPELCNDIFNFATYYTNIIFARSSNPKLQSLYAEIKELKMTVAYPFLMKVNDDFRSELITEENLLEIVRLSISYVVRRNICGIEARELNKSFMYLRNGIDNLDYMNTMKTRWTTLERSSRFPDDKEFFTAFLSKDIYHMDRRRYYILGKLENFENKETVIPQNYTIEHVMPQNENLSRQWREELGDNWEKVHGKYLHTIGNLTLTAYNSELGDKPFSEKLKMDGGYLSSGLRLNEFIRIQTQWNEEKIRERAKILADKAVKIWQYPFENGKPAQAMKKGSSHDKVYCFDDYPSSELTRKLFELLDKRIKNLSDEVTQVFNKKYIAYKAEGTNFADVIVLKTKLKIIINMKFKEVIDPLGFCRDVSNIGTWGNGEVEIHLETPSQIDYVMEIIEQSFDKQQAE